MVCWLSSTNNVYFSEHSSHQVIRMTICVLHLEEENAIFSGDTVLGEGTCVSIDWKGEFVNLQHEIQTANTLSYPKNAINSTYLMTVFFAGFWRFIRLHEFFAKKYCQWSQTWFYPAHGALVKNPVEHVTYYINHRNQREAQIIAVLTEHSSKSLTPMELVKAIYVVCMCALAPTCYIGFSDIRTLQCENMIVAQKLWYFFLMKKVPSVINIAIVPKFLFWRFFIFCQDVPETSSSCCCWKCSSPFV